MDQLWTCRTPSADLEAYCRGWTRARGETEGCVPWGPYRLALFPRFGHVLTRAAELQAWEPVEVDDLAAAAREAIGQGLLPPAGYWVAIFSQDDRPPTGLEAHGYRHIRSDWVMVLDDLTQVLPDLSTVMAGPEDLPLVWAAEEVAGRLDGEHFCLPDFRLALTLETDGAGGSVITAAGRSAQGDEETVVIDYVVTRESHRRRGLSRRILSTLLADARDRGFRRALLISTEMGQPLYLSLGFRRVALFHGFEPADLP